MQEIGDHVGFVLTSYLFVFGIWTAASSYDYIRGKWQTVASARRRGVRHIFVLVFPMIYMLAYIKYQADAKDFKEMSGGIVAVLFALIEFFRTVVGLWQLHIFRYWMVASMESLGYTAEEKKRDYGDDGSGEEPVNDKKNKSRVARNLFRIADNLIVNDLIMNNRLSEGEIEVLLRARSSGGNKNWKRRLRNCTRWMSRTWYFPRLLVAICHSRELLFSSPSAAFYLKPYDAEDIFMRWASVLVAQAFPKWLQDMQKSGMSDMPSEDCLSQELSRFRRGFLCSAALHTQGHVVREMSNENQTDTSGVAGHSHLDFKLWHNYPKLCKRVFSLQEFLGVACESGSGLPFGEPHTKTRAGGKDSEYSYSKFKSKLHRIRESFPVDDVETLEQFETFHLEWLAIFLSVPDWVSETRPAEP